MGVTHFFRADEFISSTPKFLALYEALAIDHPTFVTLPPIMGPDGKKKLGKRDGAKDILEYKKVDHRCWDDTFFFVFKNVLGAISFAEFLFTVWTH